MVQQSFLIWNCNSIDTKFANIQTYIYHCTTSTIPSAIFLSEPKLSPRRIEAGFYDRFQHYIPYCTANPSTYGGLLTYIYSIPRDHNITFANRQLTYESNNPYALSTDSNIQWFSIRIKGLLEQLVVASIYINPVYNQNSLNFIKYEILKKYNLYSNLMLLGDFISQPISYNIINNKQRTPTKLDRQINSIQDRIHTAISFCRYNEQQHNTIYLQQLLTTITYNRLITSNQQSDDGNYGIYIRKFKSLPGIDLCTIYTKSAQHCGVRDRFRLQRVPLKHCTNRYYGNEDDNITCEQCLEHEPDVDETIDHVLLHCSMYHSLRQQLIHDMNTLIPNTLNYGQLNYYCYQILSSQTLIPANVIRCAA